MNFRSIQAIYVFEMTRFFRTLLQSFVSPVISTCLYFVVFGAAIGGRIDAVEGINYIAFIVPGLIMLSVMTQAVSNASFGIYFPKFIGTIYEVLSAPINFLEIVVGYVGAAASKALFIGLVILATSLFFVDIEIIHPIIMILFLVFTCISFSLGILAEAGLSYIGLGAQPPTPSWGRMLADAQTMVSLAPRLAIVPGIAIILTVLGLNLLGDGLRDALDPKLRGSMKK